VWRKLFAICVVTSCLAFLALKDLNSSVVDSLNSNSAAQFSDLTPPIDISEEGWVPPETMAVSVNTVPNGSLCWLGKKAADLRTDVFKTYLFKRSLLI
jgi:hypothetical protein